MTGHWSYRLGAVFGTTVITVVTLLITNLQAVHKSFAQIPYFGRPAPEVIPIADLGFVILTVLVILLGSLWPLFRPQPRRLLDTILLTQRRVILAMITLAAIGYFNYTYRLPRTTVMLMTATLLVVLPVFMTAIRRPSASPSRAVVVGDDATAMQSLVSAADVPVVGYVSPPAAAISSGVEAPTKRSDGGELQLQTSTEADTHPAHLGGLSEFEDVVLGHDIDTVLVGFSAPDREEFFGVLEQCHDHGLIALVHADHADSVLNSTEVGMDPQLSDSGGDRLRRVALEPLDLQDRIVKRLFDIGFAGIALLGLSPIILLIAAAIKLEDRGPILYRQERTAAFGETFTVAKFRSMTPADETVDPDAGEEDRITRVGRVLRKTHFDEIPQLWAILTGKMSVVGPRATWTEEEQLLERETETWRKRWFIKPGLTGLAQINDATSADPEAKLRYDLEYIRNQSFWFDLKIVIRQLYMVTVDAVGFFTGGSRN